MPDLVGAHGSYCVTHAISLYVNRNIFPLDAARTIYIYPLFSPVFQIPKPILLRTQLFTIPTLCFYYTLPPSLSVFNIMDPPTKPYRSGEFSNFIIWTNTYATQLPVPRGLPQRPAQLNKQGKEIAVKLNTFNVQQMPTIKVYQYDVSFPEFYPCL
jgi:hypothetical protein